MMTVAGFILAGAVYLWRQGPDDSVGTTDLIGQTNFELPSIGFAKVTADYTWQFPQDYGPHSAYQREQWQIKTLDDCPTPFSLTIERVSVLSEDFPQVRSSAWATRSILTADLTQGDTRSTRASRAVLGLAGTDEQQVWVEDWSWNWVSGHLHTDSLDMTLTLGETTEPTTDGTWHRYTRTGQADTGCSVELTHQFGT